MAEKKVKEMLEEGLSPSDVLKSIADEEKGENNAKKSEKTSTRRLATKDLSGQDPFIQASMKSAIK